MKKLLLLITVIAGLNLQAQEPEQDCVNAIPICQTTYVQPNSYFGSGEISGEISGSCLASGEVNSVWYKVMITSTGDFGFTLCPNGNDDYDWAVYNLTNNNCSDLLNGGIGPTLEVSCNFSESTFPSACTGPNGGPNVQEEPLIPVQAGDVYFIIVSSWTSNQSGYTLDFSVSTAGIAQCAFIEGYAFVDLNNNCMKDVIDPPAPMQLITTTLANHNAQTNDSGYYRIAVPANIDMVYNLIANPGNQPYTLACTPTGIDVHVTNAQIMYTGNSFPYQSHVGVNENAILPVTLYPNPASNTLTFKFDNLKEDYSIAVYNASGMLVKQVKNSQIPETVINVNNLAVGLYSYQITTAAGKTSAGRFVKE